MEFLNNHKNDIAFLLIRLIVGILFLIQGYDKLFGMGINTTTQAMKEAMKGTRIPSALIGPAITVSSLLELIGGCFLLFGFLIVPSAALLGINLVVVVFAMTLREPLWDTRYVWPRLVLILLLLLLPMEWDRFSLDNYFQLYGATGN